MKSNELMLGNWVLYHNLAIQIDAIHKRKVGYHKMPSRLHWIRLNEIQPIPLSKYELELSGFKTTGLEGHVYTYGGYDNIGIGIKADNTIVLYHSSNGISSIIEPIKYVHELQNLLAAFKINIKIIV